MAQALRRFQAENDEGFSGNGKNKSIYLYYSESNTPRNEIYEIVDPEDVSFAQEGSFAMSANIEYMLNYFSISGAEIKSPARVLNYLYRYPEVAELAQYAAGLVAKRFGPDVKLFLEVYQDRGAQFENLVLYIRQRNYDNDIMNTIKEIRKEYGTSFPRARGKFLLTTDFLQPG